MSAMSAGVFLTLPILLFSFFGDRDFDDFKNDFKVVDTNSKMEIAQDANFANKTLNFNGGQTIYVRVTADNDGKDKHDLNLRDNNYNLITTYSMNKNGNQFLVNFQAPNATGIYSLEANVVSSGSVSNFVQTIEVGEGGSESSQVNVKINNQVNTGNQVLSDNDQTSPSPNSASASPDASLGGSSQPEETEGFFASLWSKVVELFKGFF